MAFGLLDKVNAITNPARSYPQVPEYETIVPVPRTIVKDVTDFSTLTKGDAIIDAHDNVRYVIGVVNGRLLLTGRRSNLSNFKKAFIWSESKIRDAVRNKGFRVV